MAEQSGGSPPVETYSSVGTITYILIGPLAWALHLTVIYGSQSTLCTFVPPQPVIFDLGLVEIIVTIASVVTALAPALLLWRSAATKRVLNAPGAESPDASFHDALARLLGLLSIIGIVWAGLIVALLPPCAALR